MLITGLVILAAVAAVLAYAATRPDSFRIERSTVIAAPAAEIYPLIADFHAWTRWSPWEGLDPTMARTYSGADAGVGAVYAWEGNKKVGAGRMAITAAEPPARIALDLSFLRPMKAENTTEFTLRPEGGGTRVAWSMAGPQPFMSKLFGLVFNIEKMVGGDFEKGLGQLKALAERARLGS